MENKDKVETPVNDESVLDKELEESISAVKAGKELASSPKKEEKQAQPQESPTDKDAKADESKKEEPKAEEPAKPQESDSGKKEGEYSFRIPNKGKFESDESFEKRTELMDLVKRRKLATSEDQKKDLSEKIKTVKAQIKNLNGSDKVITPVKQEADVDPKKEGEEDPAIKADKDRLKALGGVTKDDLDNYFSEKQAAADVKNTLDRFIDRHTEFKDADVRDVFFDFVDSNYNWQGKTGKSLMTVLELAREAMFKEPETVQERVLKGVSAQEKVNAMQFPGGTIVKQSLSDDQKKSVDELVATGLSEEKALELISE